MRPLFNDHEDIRDGYFVIYDGPDDHRFGTMKLVTRRACDRLISANRDISIAKPAFVVKVKERAESKQIRRERRDAIRERAIASSKAIQAARFADAAVNLRQGFERVETAAIAEVRRIARRFPGLPPFGVSDSQD